jgi:hypothetical protein
MLDDERNKLLEEIQIEYSVGPLAHRTHYSKATYQAGCRGPMCRKKERDATKERQEQRERKSGLPYRPQVDTPETCEREDLLFTYIQLYRQHAGKEPVIPRRPVYPPGWWERKVG